MERLVAQSIVSDMMLMRGIEKDYLDKEIKTRLAHSLADEIMKDERFSKIIVKREDRYPFAPSGETTYMAEVVMLTIDEAKEYRELQKLKEALKLAVI